MWWVLPKKRNVKNKNGISDFKNLHLAMRGRAGILRMLRVIKVEAHDKIQHSKNMLCTSVSQLTKLWSPGDLDASSSRLKMNRRSPIKESGGCQEQNSAEDDPGQPNIESRPARFADGPQPIRSTKCEKDVAAASAPDQH